LARSSKLSRHKNSKLAESVGEEVHLDEDDDLVLDKHMANIRREGSGIGNEFLKIAQRVEPLIGSGDKLSFLIFSCFLFIILSLVQQT